MSLDPRNRFLLLEEAPQITEPTTESMVLLPENYKINTNNFGVYKISQISTDCVQVTLDDIGKLVVVEDHMVSTASLDQGDFLLVQENHVFGVLG
jgi:hypothetical protein|tara:strand:+ start:2205 stop:2489 length:285 start_codon:yes stop_codon:yes gene_type:complete